MSFSIRNGREEDIELIYNFICELAEYEKLSHDVTATPEILRNSIFVDKRAEVLLAFEGDTAVGFALFFHNFSTFKGKACLYLEDIYISPKYRGKGYGKQLFKRLALIALERDCERFDWSVLDWNKPAIEFYKGLGATMMEDWRIFRLTTESLKKFVAKEI